MSSDERPDTEDTEDSSAEDIAGETGAAEQDAESSAESDSSDEESDEESASSESDASASLPPAATEKRSARPETSGGESVRVKVRRQDEGARPESRRWEEFEVPRTAGMTVATVLAAIRVTPVTKSGESVAPVAFDADCLEEVCGACTMLVNGKPRLACATLVDDISPKGQVIVLEPLSSFLLVRDLVVDRSRMHESLRKVEAWVSLDGRGAAEAPSQSPKDQRRAVQLSGCIDCGACLEACPQYGPHSDFVGALAINEVERLDRHPAGRLTRDVRLDRIMGPGGLSSCGKAQNCVEVCPSKVPLTESIAAVSRSATRRMIKDWILG